MRIDLSPPRRFSRADLAAAIALCLLCLVTFSHVRRSQFVPFDDDIEIYGNPHLQSLAPANLAWMFTNTSLTERYTPLSWLAWALLYHFFGLNPAAFHIEALLVHVLNTVLVFVLLRSVLTRAMARAPPSANLLTMSAALGAALWAVHPMRVEVVAWATQVRFAEAAAFALAALLLYFAAVDRSPRSPWRTTPFWLSVASYAVSLLFYPSNIGLALLLPLLDVYPLRRATINPLRWKQFARFVLEKTPFYLVALLAAAMAIYGRLTARALFGQTAGLHDFGLPQRVMQAAYIFMYYVWKPLSPLHISPVYTTLVRFDAFAPLFTISLLALLVVTLAAIVLWKKYPQFTVLWAAHLLLIFPMGGYFEHPHYSSDRYAYFEGIVWALAIAALLAWGWKRLSNLLKIAVAGLAAVIVLLLALLSFWGATTWATPETLFQHILAELGNDPYQADIHWRLGKVYLQQGRDREAFLEANKTLEVWPGNIPAQRTRAYALIRLTDAYVEGGGSPAAAKPAFLEAARTLDQLNAITPAPEDVAEAGYAYAHVGDFTDAFERLKAAAASAPTDARIHWQYGVTLLGAGQKSQAMSELNAAVQLAPQLAPLRQKLLRSPDSSPPRPQHTQDRAP